MLISDDYREAQETMHENPEYGMASVHYAPMVSELINQIKVDDILDYGSGKGRLGPSLELHHKARIYLYDPAIPSLCSPPEPHEMVCCIDVLEHVEPEFLDDVLDDLQRVTKSVGFFTIATGPAKKILPDGRNAHLIQENEAFWLPKIMQRFTLQAFNRTPEGMVVIVHDRHLRES